MATIIVRIAKDGKMQISVEGCPGPQCEELTRDLIAKLGPVTSSSKTDEYYQTQLQEQEVKV